MPVQWVKRGVWLLLAAVLFGCLSANRIAEPMQTVASVDLQRYMGRWYELAKIPNRFQAACASNTTAEYTLMDDGRVRVLNRCLNAEGEPDQAEGVARVVDPDSRAKLQVSFVSLFGYRLFWGDYWVIGLDDDYQYAVIGHPERKYGWVLAREKSLSEAQWRRVDVLLREQGYDPGQFERSPQR